MFSAGAKWKKNDERKMPAKNNVRCLHVARETFHVSLETIHCLLRDLLKGRSDLLISFDITFFKRQHFGESKNIVLTV